MKRILSLLLALMMIFGVFSVMISASAASTINTVRINDLTEPTAGGTPDYTATVGQSTAYKIDYIDWYDKTAKRFLKDGDKFEAGHTYQLQVYIDSKSGYEFKTNSNGTAAVDAFLNGKSVTATKTDGTAAIARVAIYYDFEVVNYIANVSVYNITEPVAGGTPDYTGTAGHPAYEIDYIDWYDKTDKKFLKSGDKFKPDHTYQLQVYLDIADFSAGYEFKTNSNGTAAVSGLLNGKTVTVSKTDGTAAWARVAIFHEFTLDPIYITDVSVTNITEPAAGKTPDYTGTVGNSAYEIDYIDWYDKTDKKFLKSGDKFKPDHTYQLQVYLDIANFSDGYEFKTNSNGTAAVTGKLNGKTVTVSKTDGTAAWARVAIFHEFTLDPIYITDVSVTNITEPAAGKTPDYTGTVGNSAYEIDYIDWYDKTAKRFLKETDKFEEGHTYQLQVFLDIANFSDGYEFKTNSNGSSAVTGKLNGKTVTVSKTDGTAAWARVAIFQDFTVSSTSTSTTAPDDSTTTTTKPTDEPTTSPTDDPTTDPTDTTDPTEPNEGEGTTKPNKNPSNNNNNTNDDGGIELWIILAIAGGVVVVAAVVVVIIIVSKKKK